MVDSQLVATYCMVTDVGNGGTKKLFNGGVTTALLGTPITLNCKYEDFVSTGTVNTMVSPIWRK